MSIVTIARAPYSSGGQIARQVADRLGYGCIGPEMIQYACQEMNVPIQRMQTALQKSPSLWERLTAEKERLLALYRSFFFEYISCDRIVYSGLAGHIFLAKVPNVIKVRITDALERRIRNQMAQKKLDYETAKKRLLREDKSRSAWTQTLYGKDETDPNLYDIILNLKDIRPAAAVAVIVSATEASGSSHYDLMRKKLKDMALAARVEAHLLSAFSEVQAVARDGEVFVSIKGSIVQEAKIIEKAQQMISDIEGIKGVNVGVAPSIYVPF